LIERSSGLLNELDRVAIRLVVPLDDGRETISDLEKSGPLIASVERMKAPRVLASEVAYDGEM
jgi:hypothetical protein